MANPQKENGYTAIANEIMEALIQYRISGEQMQCLLFLLRKTYGFNKKDDCISNSQFVRATGINKQNVYRAINGLIDKNIVIKKDYNPHPNYCFNKNYKTWKPSSKKITVIKKDNESNQKRLQVVIKKDTHKRQLTKDTITKDTLAFDVFWKIYPKKVGKQECLKIWLNPKKKKIRPSIDDIVKALEIQKVSENWTKEDGRFIPNPSTWLNQGRWDDELKPVRKVTGKDLQPKTYAQAQDAERRQRIKWLKGELENDRQKESAKGTDEDVPQLPYKPTHK